MHKQHLVKWKQDSTRSLDRQWGSWKLTSLVEILRKVELSCVKFDSPEKLMKDARQVTCLSLKQAPKFPNTGAWETLWLLKTRLFPKLSSEMGLFPAKPILYTGSADPFPAAAASGVSWGTVLDLSNTKVALISSSQAGRLNAVFKQESVYVQDTQLVKSAVCCDSQEWLVVDASPLGMCWGFLSGLNCFIHGTAQRWDLHQALS